MLFVRQSESAECGLACLAMVASAHGLLVDLPTLRSRFDVSGRGATLKCLLSQSVALGLNPRPVKLEMDHLRELKTPCILHWSFNHFVVLEGVKGKKANIADPAIGRRQLPLSVVADHFTGVALELRPSAEWRPADLRKRLSLKALTGTVTGLPLRLLQLFTVTFVLEIFALTAPFVNQLIVDEAIATHDFDLLVVIVIGFGLLLVTQTALSTARAWLLMLLSRDVKLQWAGNVFAHLLRLPPAFFERRHLGDVVSRFGAVEAIQKTLTTSAIEAVVDGVMAIAALVLMFLYSAQLAAIVFLAVALYAGIRFLAYGSLRNASAERLVLSAKEQSHFLETLRAMVPIKLFGRAHERAARWQNLAVDVQNRDVHTAKLGILFSSSSQLLAGIENLAVYGLAAHQIMQSSGAGANVFTVGMLFAFSSYKAQFSQRVTALTNYAVEIRMLSLQADRLADIVLSEPEQNEVIEHPLDHLTAEIEFRGVSFRYGSGEPWVLNELNLRIGPGQYVAVVGASGSGKTTLLKLLLGLVTPTSGEILYGGVPLRHIGIQNYRRLIGAAMQDDVLLSGSIADNVSFFDREHDQRRVEAVCESVGLHDDVLRMPMGYRTLVGDLGTSLSGGQKQRLLVARAVYRKPAVLVLDEATSHLDLLSERRVIDFLAGTKATRVIIAHRPETIAGCDRVIQVAYGGAHEMRVVPGGEHAFRPSLAELSTVSGDARAVVPGAVPT